MESVTPVLLLSAIATLAAGIVLYNRLVTLRNRVRNAYSQIDVQLQRRYSTGDVRGHSDRLSRRRHSLQRR